MYFDKYDKLGDYHWREWEKNTAYGKHANRVADWIKESDILDLGAGDGLITYLLRKKGKICIGIDDNLKAIEIAESKGMPVILGDAYSLPFTDKFFDAVYMGDIIEHLEFPDKSIEEVKRVLNDKGYLYVVTPPAGKVVHDPLHYKEYTKEELKDYIESKGFILIEPITIDYVRMYAKFRLK